MENVLKQEPDNRYAYYYIGVAKSRIAEEEKKTKEQEISNILQSIKSEYDAGRYDAAASQARKLLRSDPGNKLAGQYLNRAESRIIEAEIKEIINRYVVALNQGYVIDFYSRTLSRSLFQRIRPDIELLLETADNFQAAASDIKINVINVSDNSASADVSFVHIIIGLKKAEGTRKVLFEGIYRWRMEKKNDVWMITDFNYE